MTQKGQGKGVVFEEDAVFGGSVTITDLALAGGIVRTDGAGIFSSSVTLPDGTLATTQTTKDNTTKIASTAYADIRPGRREGFLVKYSSTTAVAITAGTIEANGKLYTLASDTTHDSTTLTYADYVRYVYVDDSESTAPTAVIYDFYGVPVWNAAKNGFYSAVTPADRCIGVFVVDPVTDLIVYFDVQDCGHSVEIVFAPFTFIAYQVNPTATWQTPTQDTDALTPINATSVFMSLENSDSGAPVACYVASKEYSDINTYGNGIVLYFYNNIQIPLWLILGASRQMRFTGQDDDDNLLTIKFRGFKYKL